MEDYEFSKNVSEIYKVIFHVLRYFIEKHQKLCFMANFDTTGFFFIEKNKQKK